MTASTFRPGSVLPPDWAADQAARRARWSRLPISQQLLIRAAQRAGRHATTAAHERLMADDDPRYRAAAAHHLRVARVADPVAARQTYLGIRAVYRALREGGLMRPILGECGCCRAGELRPTWTCAECGLLVCDECGYVPAGQVLCDECALPMADATIAAAGGDAAAGRRALLLAARILEAEAAQSAQRAAAYRDLERGRTLHSVSRAVRRQASGLRWRAATDPLRDLGSGDVRRLDLPRPSSARPVPAELAAADAAPPTLIVRDGATEAVG